MCSDEEQQRKKSNQKKVIFFKDTATNYDVPSHYVCVTSFEGFVLDQPVFRFVTWSVLSSKVLLFFLIGSNFIKKTRLGSKPWWPMASLGHNFEKGPHLLLIQLCDSHTNTNCK